jgi:hypothetical protein
MSAYALVDPTSTGICSFCLLSPLASAEEKERPESSLRFCGGGCVR